MPPTIIVLEGSAQMASKTYWPILKNISMFSLRISTTGMHEPYWYPETAEMGYVLEGYASMTILSPNGDHRLDIFKLKPDDCYFIPRAYPHHIENISNREVKTLIFFDQSIAGDIGYKPKLNDTEGSFSAYSREVFATNFRRHPTQLANGPFNRQDLLT